MNRDPLSELGGINLYGMVGNNPINDVDEYGFVGRLGGPSEMDIGTDGGGNPIRVYPTTAESMESIGQRGLEVMGMSAVGLVTVAAISGVKSITGKSNTPKPRTPPPDIPMNTRFNIFLGRVSGSKAARNPKEALKLLSRHMDDVEDSFSGIAKNPNPGLKSDRRMYSPRADKITSGPNGSRIAISKGHITEMGRNGSIVIKVKKTGQIIFRKKGAGK